MKTTFFIDKSWQISVAAFVCSHYEKGSLRLCVEPRCGGSALTESDYEEAKPNQANARKRNWHLPGKQGLKVEVMPFSVINALESKNTTELEVAQ